MRNPRPFLVNSELKDFLRINTVAPLDDLFHKTLTEPLMSVLAGGQKNFRQTLVKTGVEIANYFANKDLDSQIVDQAVDILDLPHTGSLVVDDIEDDSVERRGVPCVHQVHGVPLAINAGNWLYFKATRIIDEINVSTKIRHDLIKECNDTLLRAHYGQALDVGVALDTLPQERVSEVAAAIIELKTGGLCALAFKMGFLLHNLPLKSIESIGDFGKSFGVALQMFDDLGNLNSGKKNKKWAEDIRLKRITSLMACAAEGLNKNEYASLLLFIKNQNMDEILSLLRSSEVFTEANRKASLVLAQARTRLVTNLDITADHLDILDHLSAKLKVAYE